MKKLKNNENVFQHSDLEADQSYSMNNNDFINNTGINKDIQLQEFWAKSDVAEIFLSVKNEDMTIQTASEILGYSYRFTYQRYREIFLTHKPT